jgi:hypothetical protein
MRSIRPSSYETVRRKCPPPGRVTRAGSGGLLSEPAALTPVIRRRAPRTERGLQEFTSARGRLRRPPMQRVPHATACRLGSVGTELGRPNKKAGNRVRPTEPRFHVAAPLRAAPQRTAQGPCWLSLRIG